MQITEKRKGIVLFIPADSLAYIGDIVPIEGKPGQVAVGVCVVNGPEVTIPGVSADVAFAFSPVGNPGSFAKLVITIAPEIQAVCINVVTHTGWCFGRTGDRFVVSRDRPAPGTVYEVVDTPFHENFPGLAYHNEEVSFVELPPVPMVDNTGA